MIIPTQMDLLSVLVLLIGANGFWKILELLLERKKHKAEVSHLYTQVNSEIITNWVAWSKKLEQRVKDLESIIGKQKERIRDLEKQVVILEQQNVSFKEKIEQLKSQLHGE